MKTCTTCDKFKTVLCPLCGLWPREWPLNAVEDLGFCLLWEAALDEAA